MRRPGPDLVTDEHDVAALEAEALERGADLDGVERRVRAAGDGDRVLARLVDDDQRDAGRLVRERQQPATSIPSASSAARASPPNASSPTAPMKTVSAPEPGGGDRLVAALAAVMLREPAADDGLARPGQTLGRDDEVRR